jgi:hypothetical protein
LAWPPCSGSFTATAVGFGQRGKWEPGQLSILHSEDKHDGQYSAFRKIKDDKGVESDVFWQATYLQALQVGYDNVVDGQLGNSWLYPNVFHFSTH